jgi:hypothetical protein
MTHDELFDALCGEETKAVETQYRRVARSGG